MQSDAVDDRLPGSELVGCGVRDLEAGRLSVEALLVTAAAARLRAAGVDVPDVGVERPLHRLYEQLAAADPRGAHSRYNALLRRLTSFASAVERRARTG